ncbi:MAG TPA: cysteine--tRNA ligase [Candidatus Paceibacterota bacterium]|nr:cysteine--tRNA ligase [Candidatus Paceibacterota bacterium]HRY76598.1 cysteine--tRNA ligase [Candidatus Paceibacterota bacterium]
MKKIKLFNTLTRQKEIFQPIKKEGVGIYSCGPTVYWNQHIGHMYAYVQWDSLVRTLRYFKYKVKWVMNVTDVGHLTSDEDSGEDKMEKGAKREGISVWEIAEKYIEQFKESLRLLNVEGPDILCRATEHIQEQIELIKKIEKNGFTYKTQTGLVFDTSKFPGYSDFANLKLDKQFSGSRVEIDPEKRNPWDFLLWITNQPNHIMQWNSPWGNGFPGWHIECTAMSVKYLGKKFDIHTGGKEHIPVHHTNEIAQAFGAFGQQTANFWLHNEWLVFNNEKMSKSLGNNVLVSDLEAKGFNPLSLRYLILTSHYRQGLNFTWKSLEASQTALNRLYEASRTLLQEKDQSKGKKSEIKEWQTKFEEAIANDLGMAQALAIVWEMLRGRLNSEQKYKLLLDWDRVLGLEIEKASKNIPPVEVPGDIEALVKERELARQQKNWKEADKIREKIETAGFLIEDLNSGPKIVKK